MSSPVLGLWQGTLAQYRGGALQPLSNALIMDLWALPGLAGLAKSSAPLAPASWATWTCSLMLTALSLLSRYLLFCFGFLALKFFVGILVLDSFVLLLGGSLLRCYLLATEERYLVPGSAASLVGSSHNPSIVHHNIHPIHHNTMGPLPYILRSLMID